MTEQEKIAFIEECMDIDEGTLSVDDNLTDYEEWDSLSILSFIAGAGEKFNKTIEASEMKKVVTVADALKLLD